MRRWKTTVRAHTGTWQLLVTDPDGSEALKAVLPAWPQHPRALLTLLEGLAMWVGQPVTAAVSAAPWEENPCAEALFGDGLVPLESALVRLEPLLDAMAPRKLRGLGDFRLMRRLHGRSPW